MLIGLLFGLGGFVLLTRGRPSPVATAPTWRNRRQDLLLQAGVEGVTPARLLGLQVGLGFAVFVVVGLLSGALSVALTLAVVTTPLDAQFVVYDPTGPVSPVNRVYGPRQ